MRMSFLGFVLGSSLIACGCDKQQAPPPTQGLEIRVPGVDVTLDKEHGLHVKAGETEVKANKEEGVHVEAPGVDVDAKRENAVDE